MLETIGATAYANTPDRILHRREVEAAREKLDAGAWDREWAEGRAMPPEGAISVALE